MSSRLALGTAQFGFNYGIANQNGQVSSENATAIVRLARAAGVDTLDTAIAYGESERRLGEVGVADWQVVSKLPAIEESCSDVAGWVRESVIGSLDRLRIPKLHGLLLHRSQQLLGEKGEAIYRSLMALKNQGKIEKIGVSIYDPEELDALWSNFEIDLVQAPFNIVDRRLASSGWLTRLHQAGTEVHTRSVFLQGLLLMESRNLPAAFIRWQPLWQRWDDWLDERSIRPLHACLGFALSQREIARVIVGVDNVMQLTEILAAAKTPVADAPTALISDDMELINPSHWSKP